MKILRYIGKAPHVVHNQGIELAFAPGHFAKIPDEISESTAGFLASYSPSRFVIEEVSAREQFLAEVKKPRTVADQFGDDPEIGNDTPSRTPAPEPVIAPEPDTALPPATDAAPAQSKRGRPFKK